MPLANDIVKRKLVSLLPKEQPWY